MSSPLHVLEAAALLLPSEERARLAERLIASLDRDPEIAAAWDEEILRRITELSADRLDSIPAGEVFEEARARLRA